MIQKFAEEFQRYIWYLLIAVLPITSMPLVSRLLGSDSVASPAIIFLGVFLVIWFLIGIKNGFLIQKNSLILALFFLIALITSFISIFYQFPLFKEFSYLKPMIVAIGTLTIGFLFFIVASSFPVNAEIRKNSLRIINYSGFIILVWCAIQAVSWYTRNSYPKWMFDFQGLVSARVLYRQRVTGFALEPSWLAHQLNLLYLPYWLSSTLTRYSSHDFRLLGLTFENILLSGGTLMLGFSLSRVGFAAFFLMLLLATINIHSRILSVIQKWLEKSFPQKELPAKWMISVIVLTVYAGLAIFALVIYSQVDPRMAGLFNLDFLTDNPLLRYFDELKFGDRVIYWLTGWNIFNDYPIAGVGLGNAGFFFPEKLPAFGWTLVEVRKLVYRTELLLNVKSLWFRLLAETGIIGFSLFIGWLVSLIPEFVRKFRSSELIIKTFGLMGMMTIMSLFFEGFSIDSFAMPYWWISFGLAVASYKE